MSDHERNLRDKLSGAKATFAASKDTAQRKTLRASIRQLQAELDDLTGNGLSTKTPPQTPMPKGYVAERRERIKAAHKTSGFNSQSLRIVQGGKASGK